MSTPSMTLMMCVGEGGRFYYFSRFATQRHEWLSVSRGEGMHSVSDGECMQVLILGDPSRACGNGSAGVWHITSGGDRTVLTVRDGALECSG